MNRRLKIAIFHLAFIYSGGGEKLVLQEYDGLKKRGYDVSIFTTVLDKKKSFPDIIGKYKIKTFLPDLKIFRGHEALKTILSCVLVPFYASRFKDYDVIFAANQPSPWIAWLINKLYGLPYISYLAQPTRFLHPRKIDKETGLFFAKKASESISARLMMTTFKRFSNWADKISIRNSSEVLVNGKYVQKLIMDKYSLKAINCPSGVKISKKINETKKNYFLVTGRHFAQKRIEYAIFALNSIIQLKPNYRLIITGLNTEYTHRLRDLVKELAITKNVEFKGYVDENKLKRLYKEAKVYLFTAPEEDFGMGVIEAMSEGTPVVAWNSSGPARVITDKVDGFLANPFDLSDFTGKIMKLITDKNTYKSIVKNALLTVKNGYGTKNHIDVIERSIQKVI